MPTVTDDTAGAMDHLRQSCAIAAGKAPAPPPPYRPEVDPFSERQVTCWGTGEWAECAKCGSDIVVVTDGRKEWGTCLECDRVIEFIPWFEPTQT